MGDTKLATARLDRLTSLRFLAAFAVFGFHALAFFSGPTLSVLEFLFGAGRAGVTFFFLLSGFVLAWSSRTNDHPGAFYRRRFARVYPAYLAALVFAGTLLAVVDPISLKRGILAPFLLQSWVPDSYIYFGVNVPAWSLSVEAFFYLVFPFLIRGLRRLTSTQLWCTVVSMLLVSAAFALYVNGSNSANSLDDNTFPIWLAFYFPLARLPEFVIGICLALLLRSGRMPHIPWVFASLFASAGFLAANLMSSAFGVVVICIVPFALLIVSAAQRDISGTAGWLRSRWAVKLGAISYCFYLVHHIFVIRLSQQGFRDLGVDGWLACAAALGGALVLAAPLHRFVELPFDKLIRGDGRVSISEGPPSQTRN